MLGDGSWLAIEEIHGSAMLPAHLETEVVIIVVQHLIRYKMPLTYWFLISRRPMDLELHVIWDRFKIKLAFGQFL